MDSTHVSFMKSCLENLVVAIKNHDPDAWKDYAYLIHQVMQSSPADLRDFVIQYSCDQNENSVQYWEVLSSLFALIWRIVGNEYREELGSVAVRNIKVLCDMDEAEFATEAIRRTSL